MTTIFAILCQVCGLSHREAATMLDVRIDTVKSWSAGRNPTPEGVTAALADLATKIDAAADAALDQIDAATERHGSAPGEIEIGLASDDHEARTLGWPCVGAHRASLALIVARGMADGHRFKIVPRGSTSATAAAIEAHGH